MAHLMFLGTGGGRFATVYQVRRTGGIYLVDGAKVHIDPGPGAALAMRELHLDPAKTDAILISHCHPDHYVDAEILVEGMTRCSFSKRGLIGGSTSAIQGEGDFGPAISSYHKRIAGSTIALRPDDAIKVRDLEIVATPTSHSDKDGIGFRFCTSQGIVSYAGDSALDERLIEAHKGARVLILNVTRPLRSRVNFHLCTEDAATMVDQIRPELAILTHFGSKAIHEGVKVQSAYVEDHSGVRTVAAMDFMRVDIGERLSCHERGSDVKSPPMNR